ITHHQYRQKSQRPDDPSRRNAPSWRLIPARGAKPRHHANQPFEEEHPTKHKVQCVDGSNGPFLSRPECPRRKDQDRVDEVFRGRIEMPIDGRRSGTVSFVNFSFRLGVLPVLLQIHWCDFTPKGNWQASQSSNENRTLSSIRFARKRPCYSLSSSPK